MTNLSFEDGWEDVLIGGEPGRAAQRPTGWSITALPIGSALKSSGAFPTDDVPTLETVGTIPECKHVHKDQLPPEEQPGGAKALILDGEWVYKAFSAYSPYSVTLSTTLSTEAESGQVVEVTVPVNVHYHPFPGGDGSLGACRWRATVNGQSGVWHTYKVNIEDRVYSFYRINANAGPDGAVVLSIDLESASEAGITYFVDDITYRVIEDGPPPEQPCRGTPRVQYERTFLLYPPHGTLTVTEFSQLHSRLANDILNNGWTTGFSTDDAGIGDLDYRRVIIISLHPDDWDKDVMRDWFATHYPGVIVEFLDMFAVYRLPVGTDTYPPASWYVPTTQLFREGHPGIDINLDIAPWGDVERGEPVYAVAPGIVHYVTANWGGVGMCVIEHGIAGVSYWIMYAHIDASGLDIGDSVGAGQIIGTIANWTGGDGGDHLHFGVSITPVTREYLTHTGWIDPVPFLKDVLGINSELVDAMLRKGDTPSPEPPTPPTPPEPPVLPLRSNNLISLHSGEPRPGWDTYWHESGANAMKVFSAGFAMQARQVVPDPNAVVIWRKHSDYIVSVNDDPVKLVDRYSEEIAALCQNTGLTEEQVIDAISGVESLNEEIPTFNLIQLRKAVAFDVGFAEKLHQRYGDGLRPLLLNVAVGNPHETEVIELLPAAEASVTYGGWLGYHAYWTSNEHRTFITDYWDYHAGRWMRWDDVFRANGVFPRYLLSEGGIVYAHDGLAFNSGLGWKACGDFPTYLQQMDTFMSLVQAWNRVHNNRAVALTLFAYGNWGWDSFDLGEGNIPLLLAHSANWR